MKNVIIETIGTISKAEDLQSMEKNLSGGILALESKHPFPGYYRDIPAGALNPRSVFLVTKNRYDEELIVRTACDISREKGIKFDGAPGKIEVYNIPAYCIRLKRLYSIQDVKTIADAFKEKGFVFQKYTSIKPYNGLIKIQKFFDLEEIDGGVYKNLRSREFFYFEIPRLLDWDTFYNLTQEVRHNVGRILFDAALGTLYRKHRIVDVIRIYDDTADTDHLFRLKDAYLKALQHL